MPARALFNYGLLTPLTAGVTRANWHLGHNMSFHDFIEALALTKNESFIGFNAHFLPQTQLCALDKFPYDFVADVRRLWWLPRHYYFFPVITFGYPAPPAAKQVGFGVHPHAYGLQ